MQTTVGRIRIGSVIISTWKSILIKNDNDALCSTCDIVLPNVFVYSTRPTTDGGLLSDEKSLKPLIKFNDIIEIWLGTDITNLSLRFLGYVTYTFTKEFVNIKGEDAMYLIKNNNIPTQWIPQATLKGLIDIALTNINMKVVYNPNGIQSTAMGKYAIKNENFINGVQLLNEIITKGGFTFKILNQVTDGNDALDKNINEQKYEPVLNVLAPLQTINVNDRIPMFIFEHNIKPNHNLTYTSDQEKHLVIKGIANNETKSKSGKIVSSKITVYITINPNYNFTPPYSATVSDSPLPGEQKTINTYDQTRDELIQTCINNYNRLSYSGFTGSFHTWINMPIVPNQRIRLYSLKYPENNGYYKVKSVITKVDESVGGDQEITLAYKYDTNQSLLNV